MDYLNLEFESSTNSIPVNNPIPQTVKSVSSNDLTKNQIITFSSLIGVMGLLLLIALILSIIALGHQPVSPFTIDTMQNLDKIAANVSIVDSAITASGFIDNTGFSAINGTVKTGSMNTNSIVAHTFTTNEFKSSTLTAPDLEINEVKTNLVQLDATILNPTSIVYADTASDQTTTLQSTSIILANSNTTTSTTISPNNIVFHLTPGNIKNLESLRFLASNLSQSTTGASGIATLLLPVGGGIQFANLNIPSVDLKTGSTFRVTATGTFTNLAVTDSVATLCIANTENKTGNQPSQIILGVLTTDGMFMPANATGQWVYRCMFSITDRTTPASTSIEAFGDATIRHGGNNFLSLFDHSNSTIDTQQGLQLTVWGSWNQIGGTLFLQQMFIEQLF
jgi:hypothetical protein